MATFKITVFPHQRRADEKYPVSIRVYWQRRTAYIGTEYYVTIYQIAQNKRKGTFELKDTVIIGELMHRIETFEKEKTRLGVNIYNYTAAELARHFEELIAHKGDNADIDFLDFGFSYYEQERQKGRTVSRYLTVLNALKDFRPKGLPVRNLTSKMLVEFENFLKTTRTIVRRNQFGQMVTVTTPPASERTIHGYMTDIRTIFNAALREYNDDEHGLIRIQHYPFRRYKMPKFPEAAKRNLAPETLMSIFNLSDDQLNCYERAILARDVFTLSFLLVGINLIDLYNLKTNEMQNGRITYKRAKTKARRKDEALISILIPPEAVPIINRYKSNSGPYLFIFHKKYVKHNNFDAAVNKGLKYVARACGIEASLSSYYARHTWATIARNQCGISKSDIDECLNHVDQSARMADVYIARDWSLIDRANRKVLDYILKF